MAQTAEEKRQKGRESSRRWRENNPDYERKYQRRYHKNNCAKARRRVRQWRKENPEKKRAQMLLYRARKATATIGDPTELQERISNIYEESCVWCGSEDNIHVDHIWPLSKGGAHAAYNLQALCGSCNSRKGDKVFLQLTA